MSEFATEGHVEDDRVIVEDTDDKEENMEILYANPSTGGPNLVMTRALTSQVVVEEEEKQREQIFTTNCVVGGKIGKLIVDGGPCANVAATTLVEKLKIPTQRHPKTYKLQWLKEGNMVKVTKQALIYFSIGDVYRDKVLCDVIPMDVCHILLGRPWQF